MDLMTISQAYTFSTYLATLAITCALGGIVVAAGIVGLSSWWASK